MSAPKNNATLATIAADLSEACMLVIDNLLRAAGVEAAPDPKVNVEAKLYAAAIVIWSIRRLEAALDAEGDRLLDLWLVDYLFIDDEDRALFLKAVDRRTAQYAVLWEAGGDWAFNTAKFLDKIMGIEADAATLAALKDAAAAARDGVARFVQSALLVRGT